MGKTEQNRTVGILIFDGVEVLDFCGPFEVFSVARLPDDDRDEPALFKVVTIAESDRLIESIGGLLVKPHATLSDHPPLDILVVPGGSGRRRQQRNKSVIDWIVAQSNQVALLTSVCTGAFLLAEGGLLDGREATTHWSAIDEMRAQYPAVTVRSDQRIVDQGSIVTSAGISAGIDMSLHIVARLHDEKTAEWTARRMEYERRSPLSATTTVPA